MSISAFSVVVIKCLRYCRKLKSQTKVSSPSLAISFPGKTHTTFIFVINLNQHPILANIYPLCYLVYLPASNFVILFCFISSGLCLTPLFYCWPNLRLFFSLSAFLSLWFSTDPKSSIPNPCLCLFCPATVQLLVVVIFNSQSEETWEQGHTPSLRSVCRSCLLWSNHFFSSLLLTLQVIARNETPTWRQFLEAFKFH